MNRVELKCPDCGSPNIVEWSKVESAQDLLQVILNDKGEYEVYDWGLSEPCWEASESLGFACNEFCQARYFPLEHYVVKDQRVSGK